MKRALILFLLVGCSQTRTEVVIGIITDLPAPGTLDEVQMQIFRDDVLIVDVPSWPIPGNTGDKYELPASIGVYSDDGSEPRIQVVVRGLHNGGKVVERQAIFSLRAQQTLFMRMALVVRCKNLGDCPDVLQTCIEGTCVAAERDSREFPPYVKDAELSTTCSSGTTFLDTKTGSTVPMVGPGCTPTQFCQEGTCYEKVGASGADGGTGGPVGEYGACSSPTDCMSGFMCVSNGAVSTCRKVCTANTDCTNGVCSLGITGTTQHACTQSCMVLSQNCTLASEACYFATTVSQPAQQCLLAGSKAEGQTCATPNDCVKGDLCSGTPLQCRRSCSTSAPNCSTGQTCRAITGQGTLGFCQ